MQRLRDAVCPTCGSEVTVTYWPYNVPLYTVHLVRGSNRDCRQSRLEPRTRCTVYSGTLYGQYVTVTSLPQVGHTASLSLCMRHRR